MKPHSLKINPLAIAAGIGCVVGALIILLGDVLTKPSEWTIYHGVTVLMVFVTIAFLHLQTEALRARHVFAALGFFVLAITGTVLVVGQSVGRQAESTDAKVMSAEATNKAIAEKAGDLADAKKRRAYAERAADKEMTGERCGRKCTDWRTNAKDIGIVVADLERQIASLGPQKPVNAAVERIADIAEVFGIDRNQARAAWTLLAPMGLTLLFEIGSIVSLGYAFRAFPAVKQSQFPSRSISETMIPANEQLPDPSMFSGELPDTTPPKGGRKSKKSKPENVIQFPAKHPVVQALERNGGSVASNRELASLMSVSDGEASKRWQEIEHLLDVRRVGKELRIALRKTA